MLSRGGGCESCAEIELTVGTKAARGNERMVFLEPGEGCVTRGCWARGSTNSMAEKILDGGQLAMFANAEAWLFDGRSEEELYRG